MVTSALTTEPRGIRTITLGGPGGLILVGGPPFQGKAVLAAHLVDILPFAKKLEVVDSLQAGAEHWLPQGPTGDARRRPLRSMLHVAIRMWEDASPRPVVVIAARAGSPSTRRMARRMAAGAGMPFLFVEARSHPAKALARLTALGLPKEELIRRMKLYDRALEECVPVDADEVVTLPAVRLKRVLSDLDAAAQTVLEHWARVVADGRVR